MKTTIQAIFIGIISVMMSLTGMAQTTKTPTADSTATIIDMAEKGNAAAQNTLGTWYYTGNNIKQDFRAALTWWSKSAKQGNADAIGNMAICFQLGQGTEKDSVMAMNLYKKAILKGNNHIIPQHEAIVRNTRDAFSCRLLYDCYHEGIGTKRNQDEAEKYLKILADKGDVDCMYNLALQYLNSKRTKEAATAFKDAAKKGKTGAIYYYGYMTFNGMGTQQDKSAGIKLIQAAADKGFKAAHYQLGKIYYYGDGADKSLDKATAHLEIAATQSKDAAWLLALCYMETTPPDVFMATQWIAEAVQSHEKEFNQLMAENEDEAIYDYIVGLKKYYIDKDYEAAIKLFKNVSKKNVAEGLTMQAVCLANKNNEKCNRKKAVKTLEKAVKNESYAAAYYLSAMYENGEGTSQDKAKATELLEKAANGGIAYAQCKIGDMYFTGNGLTQDYVKAAQYYIKAEMQNYLTPASAKKLAVCYERGISSLPDISNAKQRIEELNKVKPNNNLINMLKAITE